MLLFGMGWCAANGGHPGNTMHGAGRRVVTGGGQPGHQRTGPAVSRFTWRPRTTTATWRAPASLSAAAARLGAGARHPGVVQEQRAGRAAPGRPGTGPGPGHGPGGRGGWPASRAAGAGRARPAAAVGAARGARRRSGPRPDGQAAACRRAATRRRRDRPGRPAVAPGPTPGPRRTSGLRQAPGLKEASGPRQAPGLKQAVSGRGGRPGPMKRAPGPTCSATGRRRRGCP